MNSLKIQHVEGSAAQFQITRLPDGKSLGPVSVPSPVGFAVEGRPNSDLMRELRWYLELFLDYPFPPDTDRAVHVQDALKAWGEAAWPVKKLGLGLKLGLGEREICVPLL